MDHISSSNPIKTVNTKSLKQYKTLFKFHYLSLYSNICNIKKMLYLSVLIPRAFSTEIMSNCMQANTALNTIIVHIKNLFFTCRVYNCSIYILDKNNDFILVLFCFLLKWYQLVVLVLYYICKCTLITSHLIYVYIILHHVHCIIFHCIILYYIAIYYLSLYINIQAMVKMLL